MSDDELDTKIKVVTVWFDLTKKTIEKHFANDPALVFHVMEKIVEIRKMLLVAIASKD